MSDVREPPRPANRINGSNGIKEDSHLHSNGVGSSDGSSRRRTKKDNSSDTEPMIPMSSLHTPTRTAGQTDLEQGLDLETVEDLVPTPPDGGWGWMIVVASFMCNVIVDGIAYTFGVMLPDLHQSFNEPKSKISMVGSLLCGVYLFAGPIVSAMTNKYGCRPVVIIGSVLTTISFVLATQSPNVDILILTYGIFGGIGMGMVYLPAIVSVGYFFEKRRAFATGLAVCGSGVGTFIFPPFIEYLLLQYSWRGCVLILAGIMLQGCLFGALMRPLESKAASLTRKSKKPRAKNILDRVKESRRRNSQNPANMLNSIPDLIIKEKVQEAKLKRQQTIQDTDTFIGSNDSITVRPKEPNSETRTVTSTTPDVTVPENKQRTFIIRTESEEGETISEEIIVVDSSKMAPKTRRQFKASKERISSLAPHHSYLEVPGVRPGGMGGSRTNLTNVSHLQSSKRSLNLSAKDLARPLYRKDIFYSGSVLNIQDVQSQPDVGSYRANVTTIPGESELVSNPSATARCINFFCGCLPRPVRDVLSEMIDLSLFLDVSFMLICLGNLTAFLGFFVPFIFLVDYALTLGISKQEANYLLSIIGITNTIGRVVVGKVADIGKVDSLVITYLAIGVCGIATILCPLVTSYALLATLAALFGLGVAAFVSLSSIVICDRLGLEKLTNGFGLLSMARGVSSMAGPPFAGYMFDSTQSYNLSFTIAGALLIAGAACHVFLHLPCLRPKHKEQYQQQRQNDTLGGEEDKGEELGPLMGSTPQIIVAADTSEA